MSRSAPSEVAPPNAQKLLGKFPRLVNLRPHRPCLQDGGRRQKRSEVGRERVLVGSRRRPQGVQGEA